MTKYLVLVGGPTDDIDSWSEVGTFDAHSAKAAVAAAITASDDPASLAASGTFAAVPSSSFSVLEAPKVNVKTTVTFA